jgi:arginase family enzyme
MQDLSDFLSPVNVAELSNDFHFTDGHFAKHLLVYENEFPDLNDVEIVMVGTGEMRGVSLSENPTDAADHIRKQLYKLHCWHSEISIADIGNIKIGALINDSYAALQIVITELLKAGKTIIILGGSHDNTIAQYNAYKSMNLTVEATCIDAFIDLQGDSVLKNDNFLLEMLTTEPNFIKHYNHIGFQSYFVHPRLLETLDKLRFDCYRAGVVKSNIHEMEPVMRNSDFVSFDICSIKNSVVPSNKKTPNGFDGEESCSLSQFAGLSDKLSSFGIYGLDPKEDIHQLTAIQIAQMIWYFIDGRDKCKQEAQLNDRNLFNEYHCCFGDIETVFLQSKRTNRWWMQLPNKSFIACSINDYKIASNNEIPERWLRAMERSA